MVATRTAANGLSPVDLEQIRDTLAAGRKPKVVFTESAGQIAGQFGQVVELTDPEVSEEWLVVRFGKDELPFSPTDLAIVPKTAPARRPNTVPAPREETPVAPASALSTVDSPASTDATPTNAVTDVDTEAGPAGSSSTTSPGAPAGVRSAPSNPFLTSSIASTAERSTVEPPTTNRNGADRNGNDRNGADHSQPDDRTAPDRTAPDRTAPRPVAKKAAKPKAPAGLTVTLAYADGDWTVAATQGTKALAKPYVIRASDALKMVAMLDVAGVHDAVDDIVSAARTEAEQQAERLRAELAEIEARLAEFRDTE